MQADRNNYVTYLNSLHNLGASGSNALAESQAMSPYFGELYEAMPIVGTLVEALNSQPEKVIVLTGHAGDGKSTIALDVFKTLKGFSRTDALAQPLSETERLENKGAPITIVKDMSELGLRLRLQCLTQAFDEDGSWLVVSNTGPLLQSIESYAKQQDIEHDVESDILKCIDQPMNDPSMGINSIDLFGKELVILNLTRIENHSTGANILARMVKHTGWSNCERCGIKNVCPLWNNRQAVLESLDITIERVRLVYQRLSAYEQRLTLRQIVAQLALSLTGGIDCAMAHRQLEPAVGDETSNGVEAKSRIVFSEGFFGFCNGRPWKEAERMKAVQLIRRTTFGGPIAVDFEKRIALEGVGCFTLPPPLDDIHSMWRARATESAGVRWRFSLRRLMYMFGAATTEERGLAESYLDAFLHSPKLRSYDSWKSAGKLTLTHSEKKRLLKSCLRVLLEFYSGFSANQFDTGSDDLYLTLRRSDRAVVQPTQLVIETLSFRDFELHFDSTRSTLVLRYLREKADLDLTLPLLDFIYRRDSGELGNMLSPIHSAKLEWFRAKLLRLSGTHANHDGEVELLRAGLDGTVHRHRYFLNSTEGILERS
jgi:hypothetical protein